MELGRIERVDPRQHWTHEAHSFTPWLQENIGLLGEALGLAIDPSIDREVSVGPFFADLLGTESVTGARILVENQLEPTDHAHLGQLITYASGLDARIVIWVSRLFRDEHRQALIWLNENTPQNLHFFGVEVELVRIGDSALAPDFRVVVTPSYSQKDAAATIRAGQPTERQQRYKEFWAELIRRILERDPRFTTSRPERAPQQSWCGFSAGRSGFQTNAAFSVGSTGQGPVLRAELYIDTGDYEVNQRAFELLEAERPAIEKEFGQALIWDPRPDIRAARIYVTTPVSIDDDTVTTDHLPWLLDHVMRLKAVFGLRVRALDLSTPRHGDESSPETGTTRSPM